MAVDYAESPPAAPVRLGLLGGFRLIVETRMKPVPMNAQRLISFLAIYRQAALRTFVAGSLWGDSTEDRAAGSLRSALWRLRDPNATLVTLEGSQLQLSPAVRVDLHEGEQLAHRIIDPSSTLDDVKAVNEDVLSADLLPDWTEDWVLVERERYRQLRLRALEALCVRLTAAGRYGQAVQAGLAAASGEPLRESARRVLIDALIAEGNTAAAVNEYEAFARELYKGMGLEPSAELQMHIRSLGQT